MTVGTDVEPRSGVLIVAPAVAAVPRAAAPARGADGMAAHADAELMAEPTDGGEEEGGEEGDAAACGDGRQTGQDGAVTPVHAEAVAVRTSARLALLYPVRCFLSTL